jgi:chromosome segregation ATPase
MESRHSIVSIAEAATLREQLALTRESYTVSLYELRQERLSWRADKLELEHLKSMLNDKDSPATPQHLKYTAGSMAEEKALHEEELEECADQIKGLKKVLHSVQQDNRALRSQVSQLENQSDHFQRIQDLEEEVNKWEAFYFESAEMGERQMGKLEQQLEEVRESLHIQQTTNQSQERVSLLKQHTNVSQEAPQEQADLASIPKQDAHVDRLEKHIHILEAKLREKESSMEQERASAEHREAELNVRLAHTQVPPDPFVERLAGLSMEMNERETANHVKLEQERSQTEQRQAELQQKLDAAHQRASRLERELKQSLSLQEENDDSDLDQYVQELEHQLAVKQKAFEELTDRLNQERAVAKNRESVLKKQLDKVKEQKSDQITCLEDQLNELVSTEDDLSHQQDIVQQLQAQLQSRDGQDSAHEELESLRREEAEAKLTALQEALEKSKLKLEATRRENQQLRQVKDSLQGIDQEMTEFIESLEPLQSELAEQTQKTESAMQESKRLENQLTHERSLRRTMSEENQQIKTDLTATKERLDHVYMDLKDEQASQEDLVESLQREKAIAEASLQEYKHKVDVMREAMREANEQLRDSISPPQNNPPEEEDRLREERDELRKEVQALRASTEKDSIQMLSLQRNVVDIGAQRDALNLEAKMALQERVLMQDDLKRSSQTIEGLECQLGDTVGLRQSSEELERERDTLRKSFFPAPKPINSK